MYHPFTAAVVEVHHTLFPHADPIDVDMVELLSYAAKLANLHSLHNDMYYS
jgi:hypothetical protein